MDQEHASSTGSEIISSQTNPTRKSPKHTATGTRWGPDWRKTAAKRRTDAFCSVSPPVAAEFNSTSTRDTRRPHDEALSQLPHPQRSKHFRSSPFLPPPPTLQPRGRQAAGCFLPHARKARRPPPYPSRRSVLMRALATSQTAPSLATGAGALPLSATSPATRCGDPATATRLNLLHRRIIGETSHTRGIPA